MIGQSIFSNYWISKLLHHWKEIINLHVMYQPQHENREQKIVRQDQKVVIKCHKIEPLRVPCDLEESLQLQEAW